MTNSDRTTATISSQSNSPAADEIKRFYPEGEKNRTRALVAMDAQFEPYEHLRNAKRYLHGEPQSQLYAKYKDSSPEVRAHWQACRILERAAKSILDDIEKRWDKEHAAAQRNAKKRELRKEKEVRAAIATLLKYTGIKIQIADPGTMQSNTVAAA